MRACEAGIACVSLLAALGGCSSSAVPDLAKAEAEVRAADAQWREAAAAHDLERTVSYWSDDAQLLVPGAPPIVGRDAIRKFVSDAFAAPDFSITWVIDKVTIAKGGDLAYGTGTNQISLTTPDGKHVVEQNKAVEVWRREADGSWKCVVDVATPAPPAA